MTSANGAEASGPRLRQAPFGYTVTLVPGVKEAAGGLSKVLWDPEGEESPKIKELVFLRSSIVNRCER
ncbi:MAG TPA: hypothetical protein VKU87_06695 [Thermomicrobiaceae bacterium]|nr:hypothetical protein [Thermomicrobiaceae bacterium]